MSDLILKASCGDCGSTEELYGSACKHLTLCLDCAKSMTQKRSNCYDCGAPIRPPFIREYNVRACSRNEEKKHFIGRFTPGLPNLYKNKWWSLQDQEKCKNKGVLLKDESGQFEYEGQIEADETYCLLMLQGKELVAIPAASCYNFNKVAAQYKQLTLEEAQEKMILKAAANNDDDDEEGLDFEKSDDDWVIFTDDDPEEELAPPEIKQLIYTFIQLLKSRAKLWVA